MTVLGSPAKDLLDLNLIMAEMESAVIMAEMESTVCRD